MSAVSQIAAAKSMARPAPIAPETGEGWLRQRSQGPMPRGAVLLHAPSAVFQAPGGGETQLVQTGRHLEALGLPVRPLNPWLDRIDGARLLHLFGMSREGLALAHVAQSRGVPVVLSPICWFERRAIAALAPSGSRRLASLAAWCARVSLPGWPTWRREILHCAAAVLPNSHSEARQLVRLFGVPARKIHVVPNGVEARFLHAGPGPFLAAHGGGEFVLYAGRIEPRKNVLGLVRAVGGLGLPLIVLGDPVPGHEAYAAACHRAGHGHVRWLGRLEHSDPLLASAYAAARVFALPSWFETPGLAALEAAIAGCAVVVTPFGCTREYFGELAEYARPDRTRQIARSVARAWDAGAPAALAARVQERFLWTHAAQITKEVYDQVAA